MKLRLREHREFREVFRNLGKNDIEDITLNLDRDRLSIKEPDRTMVMFFNIDIKSSYFDEYKLDSDKTVGESFTVSLIDLNNILKNIDKNAKIEFNTSVKDTLNIISETEYLTKQTLPLLEVKKEEVNLNIDTMTFKSSFTINSKNLIEIIRKFNKDNSLTIETDSIYEKIHFTTDKHDNITIFKGTDILSDLNLNNAKSRYSIELLSKLSGFFKLFDKVKVSFSEDYPIKFNMSNENINIEILLAPRISEEWYDNQRIDITIITYIIYHTY